MKHYYLIFLPILLCSLRSFSQTPDFSLYGYAAMEGGTSGGAGGPVVTPGDFVELQQYASGDEPYTILIDREFKGPDVLRLGSNKTLLGVGTAGFFNQIGVSINSQHNIIIRNIRFTMTGVPITNDGENKIEGFNFDPDCIAIQADDESLPESERKSHHIWVDHCEFYNEDPNVMTDYDRYDGLMDAKNDCQYITISWNYFHDHHKACLSGKGNSDNYDRKTTMHHNKFENIKSRMPLLRYGKLHMLNNYMVDCPEGNGLNVRIESNAYVEKNWFENVKKPIFGKISEGGRAHLIDNRFIDCGRLSSAHMSSESPDADPLSESEEFEDTDYVPPYLYVGITYPVNDVPSLVNQFAGIGKLEGIEDINQSPVVSLSQPESHITIEPGQSVFLAAMAEDSDGSVSELSFYANETLIATVLEAPYQFTWQNIPVGVYEVSAIAKDNDGAISTSENIIITVEKDLNLDCAGVENGSAYLDDCGVCVGGNTGYQPCAGNLEAETACAYDGKLLESDNPGYSGEGYVNTTNKLGSFASWTLNSETDQTATITFRYANGGGSARNGELFVNGQSQGILSLDVTGGWETWETVSMNINFTKGANEILLEAVSGDGLANLDVIYFSEKVSEASCDVITSYAEENESSIIRIHPNPTSGVLFLSAKCTWKIVSYTGAEYLTGFGDRIDISGFYPGFYFLQTEFGTYSILKK